MLYFVCIVTLLVSSASSIPLHASCELSWSFTSTSCDIVRTKLVQQIQEWNGPDNCAQGGEKCLYSLVSNSGDEVTATHTTPKKKYVDSLSMKFSSTLAVASLGIITFEKLPSAGGCAVAAHSSSNTWYAILDFGTNYCNLHNLVVGSGLANATDFSETTSDSVCTQYSKADCDTY